MATLEVNGQQKEVEDNMPLQPAADELGIMFGCRSGMCRTCECEVVEGMENLSPKNERENAHDLPENHRLMCQAEIKSGKVVVKQEV
jgi:ferredoxin